MSTVLPAASSSFIVDNVDFKLAIFVLILLSFSIILSSFGENLFKAFNTFNNDEFTFYKVFILFMRLSNISGAFSLPLFIASIIDLQ